MFFHWFVFILFYKYIKCIVKPLQCQQRCRSCYEVSYPNATNAKLLCFSIYQTQQDYHAFFFFLRLLPSRHCFKYHVCIYILGLQLWSVICLPGEIYDLFNVETPQQMFTHLKNVILGKTYSSLGLHLVLILSSENYIVWIHIKPFMSDRLNTVCGSSQENYVPQLCRYLTHKKTTTHFKSLWLSALYIGIYLFFGKKKKKTVFDLKWRGENISLILHRWGELMVFIQFIFYTLCTLIHKDADIQLILCFTLHWFSGKHTSHSFSYRTPQEREIKFS